MKKAIAVKSPTHQSLLLDDIQAFGPFRLEEGNEVTKVTLGDGSFILVAEPYEEFKRKYDLAFFRKF